MSDDKKYIPQLTLETVWDIKNGKEIDAYEFFNQPESEIINMRNLLQLAINTNTPYYVCPYCRQMVKISGRKNERGKANFFSHLYDSDLCPIKTTTGLSKELINNKYRLVNESDRHKYLKSLIAQSLSSETSIQKGVSDVEIEKRIDSPIPYLRWRRPDVFAKYKNKNIVFELQLSTTFVSIIVDRDLFYRLNDYYIIWVFNFDDNKEYVNLSNLMCKDIYYANKRNVFIFDKEAQAASIERGELILKCNWLKPDNKWNYEKSNGGYSGVLVSLDQLSFDEDNKKPFFHDADAEYFSIHPDYLNIRKEIEADRQEIVQKIMEQEQKESDEYDGQTEQERERSILEMKRNGKRVSIFKKKNKYGLSYEDTIMVPAKYTSISDFDEHGHATIQYKKRKGIVDCYGRIIVPCEAAIINLVDNKYFIYHKSSTQYWFMSGIDEPIATYGNDNISVNDTENKKEIIKISFDENHDLWFWQKDKIFIINGIIAVFKNYSLDKPKWGAQYINGDVLVPFVFNNVKEITDAIRIEGNEMDFWVDSSSRYIFSQYSSIDIHGVNKLIVTHKNNFSGLARFDGKIVVDCKCDKIDYFGKYYILERDSKWAIADENGKIIYNYQDNIITMMTDNYIYMKDKEGKAFLCDNQRNFIRWNGNYSCIIETDVSGLFVVTSSAENKKGIVNLAGEIIIPCLYEDILPWGVNLYRVEKNIISKKEKPTWSFEDSEIRFEDKTEKRFYLINDSSNKTNPDLFKSIDRLSNGKIHAVTEDDREGYLDINGEMIPIKSESMGSGYNKIFSFGRWGVVDSNNNYILPCHFLEIDWFTNQIFKVKTSALHFQPYKLYDINGACISKGYFEIKSFENGYAAADNTYLNVHGEECFLPVMSLPNGNIIGHNHNHYGLYDEHGAVLSEPIYAKIDLWKKKLLFYYKTISNNKSCITIHNLDGSQIGNQGYDKIEDIEPGMCKVWLGEGYGFFDENWELIPVKSESMNGGYTKILSFGKWGVISSNKDIILPPNFLEIDWFTNQLFKVKTLSSRYQIYDLNGVCISKEFLLIDKLKDGYAVADDTFLDPQGKECFLPIVKLPNGCLIGFNHNHYGLYDEHGIILSEPVNDKIERWGENLLFYYKASKSNGIHSITIHRLDGTLLKNIKYDKIEQVEPGKCKVWVGNTYGYLDAKGKELGVEVFKSSDGNVILHHLGKFGIRNSSGKMILRYKYEDLQFLDTNAYLAHNGTSYILIDEKGSLVKDIAISEIININNGIAEVKVVNRGTCKINKYGDLLPNTIFETPNGIFVKELFGDYSIQKDGEILADYGVYKEIKLIDNRQFIAKKYDSGHIVVLDTNFHEITIERPYTTLEYVEETGHLITKDESSRRRKYGLITLDGEEIDDYFYESLYFDKTIGYYVAQLNRDKYIFISKRGSHIYPFGFEKITINEDGCAFVFIRDKKESINCNGPIANKKILQIDDSHFIYQWFDGYGICKENGETVTFPNYSRIEQWNENIFICVDLHNFDEPYSLIQEDGKELVRGSFISSLENEMATVYLDELDSYKIDSKGQPITSRTRLLENFYLTYKDGLYGLEDAFSNTIVTENYSDIIPLHNGLFEIRDLDNKFGIIKSNGEVVVPCENDCIFSLSGNLICLKGHSIIKTDISYEYTIPILTTIKTILENGLVLDIGKKTAFVSDSAIQKANYTMGQFHYSDYLKVIISHINWEKKRLFARFPTNKDLLYIEGQIIEVLIDSKLPYAIIAKDRNNNNIFIHKSMISPNLFSKIQVHNRIKIVKKGFDNQHKKDIWQIIDESTLKSRLPDHY